MNAAGVQEVLGILRRAPGDGVCERPGPIMRGVLTGLCRDGIREQLDPLLTMYTCDTELLCEMLCMACRHAQRDIVLWLLERPGLRPLSKGATLRAVTATCIAGDVLIARMLGDGGAPDVWLDAAAGEELILTAAMNKHSELMCWLVDRFHIGDAFFERYRDSLFRGAVQRRDHAVVDLYLDRKLVSKEYVLGPPAQGQFSPFGVACSNGYVDMCNKFIVTLYITRDELSGSDGVRAAEYGRQPGMVRWLQEHGQ